MFAKILFCYREKKFFKGKRQVDILEKIEDAQKVFAAVVCAAYKRECPQLYTKNDADIFFTEKPQNRAKKI